jgi:hypothetical protein
MKLAMTPLCELCDKSGRWEPATHVHHIKPIEEGGDLLPTLDGLMSVCRPHHNKLHGNGSLGCDVNGVPIDPGHPFFG